MMDEQIKKNLSSVSIWLRLAYMLFFAFVIYLAMGIFMVAVLVQFLIALITGKPNLKLAQFSDVLCQYISQCLRFECFVSDHKPFPFDDFPESSIQASTAAEVVEAEILDEQDETADEKLASDESSDSEQK